MELKSWYRNLFNSKNVGGRYGSGHQDGGCREWSRWKIKYDSAILQRHFYKRLQEDHWSWFFGATNPVCIWPFYLLGFDLWTVSKTFARIIVTNYSPVHGEASEAVAHEIVGGGFRLLMLYILKYLYLSVLPHFHPFSLPLSCSFPIPIQPPFSFYLISVLYLLVAL